MEPSRTLSRYPDAGRVAGVCAGVAAYFNIDVTLVRLLWVVLSIVPGVLVGGVIAYAAAWLFMPVVSGPAPASPVHRVLVRPVADRKIAGVCAGIAHYLGLDTTVVRLLWVILSIYPGVLVCGLLFYAAAWLVIPSDARPPRFESLPSTSF